MWFGFFRKRQSTTSARPRPSSVRLRLDVLEDRDCPSGGGLLDTSFNGTGIVSPAPNTGVVATVVQADGKAVGVGTALVNGVYEIEVVRMNSNGSPDTTFNTTGTQVIKVGVRATGNAVTLQPDGKILIASNPFVSMDKWNASNYDSEYAVVRLNSNGTLDTTFGNSGKRGGGGVFTYNPTSGKEGLHNLAVLANGSIIASGDTGPLTGFGDSFVALKLTPNGTLDTTFGSAGSTVVHLTPTGLGSDNTYDEVNGMAVVPGTNQVVMVGSSGPAAVVVLTAGGQLDTSFNGTGYRLGTPPGAVDATYVAVAIQPQLTGGYAIVAAGSGHLPQNSYSALAARYTLSGTLDTTFGGAQSGYYFQTGGTTVSGVGALSGYFTTSSGPYAFAAIGVEQDGSLVLGGSQYYWDAAGNTYTTLAVGHFSADGLLDTTFGTNNGFTYVTALNGLVEPGALAIDPTTGKIVVCNGKVARLTAP